MPGSRLRALHLIGIGVVAALSGVILYASLSIVVGLGRSLVLLYISVIASLVLTVGGMITAIVGVTMWARRAPLVPMFLVVVPTAIASFLLFEFADVNVHGPAAVLLVVLVIAGAGSTLLLLVAGIRSAASLRKNRRAL